MPHMVVVGGHHRPQAAGHAAHLHPVRVAQEGQEDAGVGKGVHHVPQTPAGAEIGHMIRIMADILLLRAELVVGPVKIMGAVARGEVKLNRKVYVFFGQQEEIGMSGACAIPEDVVDYLAVDIGCVSPETSSDEHKVTVTAQDTGAPYNGEFVKELADLAEAKGIPFVLDVLVPHYGSDAEMAMRAGFDARHGLIGPGVLETHGYERTHRDALINTTRLLCAVIEA